MTLDELRHAVQQMLDEAQKEYEAISMQEVQEDFTNFDTTQQRSYEEGFLAGLNQVMRELSK